MLNWVFVGLIGVAVLTAAFNGTMPRVTEASIASARGAVELAIGLVGQMSLWLGFMGVLREAGLMRSLARALEPLMRRLFPEVPPEHPAMGAMVMNLAANILGLGNAATPFGLKAMGELERLNPRRGVATDAMALFLVINTSGVAVLPLGVVAVRAALGSRDPAGIIVPSVLGTFLSTLVAIVIAKLLARRAAFAPGRYASATAVPGAQPPPAAADGAAMQKAQEAAAPVAPASGWRLALVLALGAALVLAAVRHVLRAPPELPRAELARGLLSDWMLPGLMLAIVAFGVGRRVKVYEAFIASAKEGFQIAIVIIPFLVAILVAIGMLRASGAMEVGVALLGRLTTPLGFPAEALPMALIRPLSGSGALAVMTETMKTYGPDSFVGYLVSLINGSSETTFYVLAVYFGSVQVRVVRHTLVACLAADLVGLLITVALAHAFF